MLCPPSRCLAPDWCQQNRECLATGSAAMILGLAYEQGRQDRTRHRPCPYSNPALTERWRDGWQAMDEAIKLIAARLSAMEEAGL
jgi:ribosome modulation factor